MKKSKKFSRCFTILLIFFPASIVSAQNTINSTEYFGKLEDKLVPDTRQLFRIVLKPIKDAKSYGFRQTLPSGATAAGGKIINLTKSGGIFNVLLLESSNRAPVICVDLNGDAALGKNECFPMVSAENNPNDFEYTLNLPIKAALYKTFPLFLRYKRDFISREMQSGDRMLMQSLLGYAVGKVYIKDRPTLVQYQFNVGDDTVSATEGLMGVDVNGDGKIRNEPFSPEMSAASKEEIIFRIGDLYLSTKGVDTVKNQIVMRSRAREEYRRAELEIGKPMPDFSFIDFNDKKRSLSDFRGKYLLVDFWGMWCIDCRRELPYQFEAHKKFSNRGFEILGMNTDENTQQIKTILQKNGINWAQTRFDSVKEIVENVYRIQEYPSAVLLDPDGKVLILEKSLLSGDELLKTLERILPR